MSILRHLLVSMILLLFHMGTQAQAVQEKQAAGLSMQHGMGVDLLAFSPDGKWLASANSPNMGGTEWMVRVWSVATARELRGSPLVTKQTWSIAFLPDGKGSSSVLVVVGAGAIRFWDFQNGKELRRIKQASSTTLRCAVSPDGKLVASAGTAPLVFVWQAANGKPVAQFRAHRGGITRLGFIDNTQLVTVGNPKAADAVEADDFCMALWDVARGQRLEKLATAPLIKSFALSRDGKVMATHGVDNPQIDEIRILKPRSGLITKRLTAPANSPDQLALTSDGKILASNDFLRGVWLWNTETGKLLKGLKSERRLRPESLEFSPDGKLLATGERDGTITLWDVARPEVTLPQR